MQGGAAVASAVMGGSLDFGFAATVNLMLAKSQGLPVKIVASGNNAAQDAAPAQGDMPGLAVHDFAIVVLGIHLFDDCGLDQLADAVLAFLGVRS